MNVGRNQGTVASKVHALHRSIGNNLSLRRREGHLYDYAAASVSSKCSSKSMRCSSSSQEVEVSTNLATNEATTEALALNEGLWKGILCNLNRDGSPQELPPQYVPDAFKEWGETLYEWNTLCESALDNESSCLTQTVKRQVPLTACESVEAQYEPLGSLSTKDYACEVDSDGSIVLASDTVVVENDMQSVVVNTCFHVSCTTRVRFDLLVRKYLTTKDAKYHLAMGSKVFLEEKVNDATSIDDLDTDGGCRQTNSLAVTPRGAPGTNTTTSDNMQQQVIGLPLNAWVGISFSQDQDEEEQGDLRIEVNMHHEESQKTFACTVAYTQSVLTSQAIHVQQ